MKKERFFKVRDAAANVRDSLKDTFHDSDEKGHTDANNSNDSTVYVKDERVVTEKTSKEASNIDTFIQPLFVNNDNDHENTVSSESPVTESNADMTKNRVSANGNSKNSTPISSQVKSSQDHTSQVQFLTTASTQDISDNGNVSKIDQSQQFRETGYDLFKSQITPFTGYASEKIIRYLHKKYFNQPNYAQLALNEFYNGIDLDDASQMNETSLINASLNNIINIDEEPENIRNHGEPGQRNNLDRNRSIYPLSQQPSTWRRYIGTLDVEAWATRPYSQKLFYEQALELKRLRPNRLKKSTIVAAKFGDSAIIRLYTKSDKREIGRLPEDITRILSPLIDLDLAEFDAFVIMATDRRLSIGMTFYVQIRCYLTNNTFTKISSYESKKETYENESPSKRRKTGLSFNFASETEGETVLRLKQKSISRLFERLHITRAKGINQPQDITLLEDESDTSTAATPNPETQVAPADELNLDQLKEFYLSNQQQDYLENLPDTTTPPSDNFAMSLRPYQKHGLAWMLSREKEMDILQDLSRTDDENLSTQRMRQIRQQEVGVMNPLWSEFRWPKDRQINGSVVHHNVQSFYANLYNGEFSLDRPVIENCLKGGILADEMGLGKTISTLSLIHSVPYDEENAPVGYRSYASKSTLIVVPMSLLSQWKSEFDRTNNNQNHRCFVYYGESVQADLTLMLCNRAENIPIVVITTYGVVQSEWTRINKMRDDAGRLPKIGLFSVEFFRMVLDEGHTIRNRTTKTARSVHELESRRRWILTGTPVVNRLDDIFSLVKYLKLEPWSNFSYWKTFVTKPFEEKKFHQTLDVVKSILQPIFLRRTKNMKSKDGTPLVALPEKEVLIQELQFSDKEQLYYDFFKSKAYQSFKEGMRTGELLKRYTQILTHILRLRQVCCHSDLIASSNELDETWKEELATYEEPIAQEKFPSETIMKRIMYGLYKKVQIEESECSICTSAPIAIGELTVTECGHQYCFHCLIDHFKYQKKEGMIPLCPQCRHPISRYRLFKLIRRETFKKEVRFHTKEDVSDSLEPYPFQLYHFNPDRSSAKIQALVAHLRDLKEQSPGEQVVVFSQFSTFLDLIENEIKSLGTDDDDDFVVYKFDGRLNMVEREKILKKFTTQNKADGRISILLLSLKAGGVGLNLTVARRVFMMDPWWSPSIEDQAVDRVHRIGQDQNVKVVRFIVQDSIEQKMLKIQERKRKMGEAVEVEEEERRRQRIEEIKLLFDE